MNSAKLYLIGAAKMGSKFALSRLRERLTNLR
jgi:hypothetical protein